MLARVDGAMEYEERLRRRRCADGSAGASAADALSHVVLPPGSEPDWPADVRKKAAVLRYLANKLGVALPEADGDDPFVGCLPVGAPPAPHVRAWAPARHAAVFRLCNGVVQLQFRGDGSQLALMPDGRHFWYCSGSGSGDAACFSLAALPRTGSAAPLLRRLRYARAVLDRLARGGLSADAEEDSFEL